MVSLRITFSHLLPCNILEHKPFSLLVQHLLPLRMLNLQFSEPQVVTALNNSTIIVS